MPKVPGPEVRTRATKAVAIKAMVLAMLGDMGRPMVACYECPKVVGVSYSYSASGLSRSIWLSIPLDKLSLAKMLNLETSPCIEYYKIMA